MNWEIVYRDDNQSMKRVAIDDLGSNDDMQIKPSSGFLYCYEVRQGTEHGGYMWSISMTFVPGTATAPP